MREQWQLRLEHEKACRDAHVACGNPAPALPDKPGSFWSVKVCRFNSKVFYASLNERGHTAAKFHMCECSKS